MADNSLRIQLKEVADYRWLTNDLDKANANFHTFFLKEANVPEVVICNVLDIHSEQEIGELHLKFSFGGSLVGGSLRSFSHLLL